MKLTKILTEGMYDSLVRQITNDTFKLLNKMIDAGLDDKKYNGKQVKENPPEKTPFPLWIKRDVKAVDVGDYNDKVSGINTTITLKYKMSDNVKRGEFYIDALAEDGQSGLWSEIELHLITNPEDERRILSKVRPYIREAVRHEIEHLTQRGDNLKASKFIRNNKKMRERIRNNPEIGYKYLILKDEIDANIHGLFARAKTTDQTYQEVVDDYLDSFVKQGDITEKQRNLVYRTWKKRIPKIHGIPNLK